MQSFLGPHSAGTSRGVWPKSKQVNLALGMEAERPVPSPPPRIDQARVPAGARAQRRSCKARAECADVSGAACWVFGQRVEGSLRGSMTSGQGRGGCGRRFSDTEPGF